MLLQSLGHSVQTSVSVRHDFLGLSAELCGHIGNDAVSLPEVNL